MLTSTCTPDAGNLPLSQPSSVLTRSSMSRDKLRTSEWYFFFQAEDGIRDYKVTGVQTCALPILALVDRPHLLRQQELGVADHRHQRRAQLVRDVGEEVVLAPVGLLQPLVRLAQDAEIGRAHV